MFWLFFEHCVSAGWTEGVSVQRYRRWRPRWIAIGQQGTFRVLQNTVNPQECFFFRKFWEFLEVTHKVFAKSRSRSKASCVLSSRRIWYYEAKYKKKWYFRFQKPEKVTLLNICQHSWCLSALLMSTLLVVDFILFWLWQSFRSFLSFLMFYSL